MIAFFTLLVFQGNAQKIDRHGLSGGVDLSVGYNNGALNPSITYYELVSVAKSKSFFIGWTARLNAFYGNNLDYYTAPARLTRGQSGIGSLTKPMLPENIDTVRFGRVSQTALNVGIRAEYYVGRFTLGASADVLGLTFLGRSRTGLVSSSTGLFVVTDASGQEIRKPFRDVDAYQNATPNRGNVRLLGDNNRGMLTTEVYARFRLSSGLQLKAGYQWLTTEMVLSNKDIVANNNRFRNRVGLLTIGLTVPLTPW